MLSADIYCDSTGKKWSAVIRQHPERGGKGVIVWQKHEMSTDYNATTAMEAAWQRLS